MKVNKYYLLFICLIAFLTVSAQVSENVSVAGFINPDPSDTIYYSGCWGYTAPTGREYALVGGWHGLHVIDISDSNNIHQVAFVPGRIAQWREIKVVRHYAYVICQVWDTNTAMQIIDLKYLPDSVHMAGYYDSTFHEAHTLSIDELGDTNHLYVCGPLMPFNNGGVHILDISNPIHPKEVGLYSTIWMHDCHVRGNIMYSCDFYNGNLDIVDIINKSVPTEIGEIDNIGFQTHSCWTTKDGKSLFVTVEQIGYPAFVYDVSNPQFISKLTTYRLDTTAIVHNVYIKGDFAYVANDAGGFAVMDVTRPEVPIEVGYYRTYFGTAKGSVGVFGAFPFYPSGKIIATERDSGLYVFRFNNTKAGRIYGQVMDSITSAPLINTEIKIEETGKIVYSDVNGIFKTGAIADSINGYTISVSAPNYQTKIFSNIKLHAEDSVWFTIRLSHPDTIHPVGQPEITIGQNPVSSSISIYLNNISNTAGSLRLINILGQAVYEQAIEANERNLTVDINSLPAGLYFLSLNGVDYTFASKIVKE